MSEEKKISLEDLEDLMEDNESRSRLNWSTLFAILVLNWQWFLLSFIIFISGAMIYLRYVEPVYQMSARMLIKDEKRRTYSNQMLANVETLGFLSNSSGIDNEVEVLQSRTLLREVVKDLKLYVEYRREGRIHDVIVYNTQPFRIDIDSVALAKMGYDLLEQMQSIKMKIQKKGAEYVVSGTVTVQGEKNSNSLFERRIKTLPDTIQTELGAVTIDSVPGRVWNDDRVYYATILPPMVVATSYMGNLSVEPTSQSTSIALLTLRDKDVRRGMDVLRQLTVCYNRQANADKNEIAIRTEEFINDRMRRIDQELGSTEDEIESFKRQNQMTNVSVDAANSVQMANQYSTQLTNADVQVRVLDYLRGFVEDPANKYQIIPSNVGLTDASSIALIANYNSAIQERNRLLMAASEQAPQVVNLTASIDNMWASIKAALNQARRSADISRRGIMYQFGKFQNRVMATPTQERVLTQVGREQNVKSSLYMLLLQKREENSISMAATADNGKLIDEPLAGGMVSPRKSMVMAIALFLALFIPCIIIWILNLLRYKIEGHEDVARLTNLPIIADVAVASENVKDKAGIVVQANRNNQIDEIFRSMRTNIQFMLKGDEKVILFTSSVSGEGKTFNAANLAVSFALLGKKVILCGLDIRKPALGRLFGLSDITEGITSLLALGKVTDTALKKQILKSGINENLDLLLAGPTPPNPTELLARENFADITKMLREMYDYIIFDTAPVGLVTDTLQIGQHADITVFVCRADYSPKSSVGLFNSLAKEGKMPNSCVVLNGIDMSKRKYGYYYGYGRYGRYGRYGYGRYGRYGYGGYGNYGSYGQYSGSHYGNKNDDSIKK